MRKKPTKSAIKLTKKSPTRNDVSNSSICSPRLRGRSTSAAPFSRSRSRCCTASIFSPSSIVRSTISSLPSLPKAFCATGKSISAKLPPKTLAVPCSLSNARTVNSRLPWLVSKVTVAPTGKLQPAREGFRQCDRIRLSDKIQRLIEAELGIDELMVSNREIREQIDAVDIQPLARHARDGRNPSTAAAASRTPAVSRISGNKDSAIPLSPLATCNTALPAI